MTPTTRPARPRISQHIVTIFLVAACFFLIRVEWVQVEVSPPPNRDYKEYDTHSDNVSAARKQELFLDHFDKIGAPIQLIKDDLDVFQGAFTPGQSCTSLQPNSTLGSNLVQQLAQDTRVNEVRDVDNGAVPGASVVFSARVYPDVHDISILTRTNMLHDTLQSYCSDNKTADQKPHFMVDHIPAGGCAGWSEIDRTSHMPHALPWCRPPSEVQYIVSIDCGVVESCQLLHPAIIGNIVSLSGLFSSNHKRWKLDPNMRVEVVDQLGVIGATIYASAPGHFINEVLPLLLFLDRILPANVPLLWPTGTLPEQYLQDILNENGLKPGRKTLLLQPPSIHYVKRLFLYVPGREESWKHAPYIAWLPQRIAAFAINSMLYRRIARERGHNYTADMATRRKYRVVVLQRTGARSVSNHNHLVQAINKTLGNEYEIDDFFAAPPMWSLAERINQACLLIGPHGANLNNIMYMQPMSSCWIVEIGYRNSSFPLPSDYYCLSRNLGFQYYLSVALKGDQTSPLEANIQEIVDIVSR